jgi:hypothetical protein
MTLEQMGDTAKNAVFRKKVKSAVIDAAVDIVGEDPVITGFSTEVTQKRHTLAELLLRHKHLDILETLYEAVATEVGEVSDPTAITDGSISTAVAAVWNNIAGVKHGE